VAPKLVLALLFLVLDGIEKGSLVGGPDHGASALNLAGQGLARLQVLDVQRVLAKALGVGGVGQPAAVFCNVGGADGEKRVVFGQQVAVQNDLFGRARLGTVIRAAAPAMNGVLKAFFGAGVIPPAALAVGNRDVGLLHMREHFPVKIFAQAAERRHESFRIGVFGFEVSGDFGILLVAQPGVVVGENGSVKASLSGFSAGDGGCWCPALVHFLPSVVPAGGFAGG